MIASARRTGARGAALAAALLAAMLAPPGLAGDFVVNSTADALDSFGPDGICDTQNNPLAEPPLPPSGLCTLRAALMQAEHDAGPSSITFGFGHGGVLIQPGSDLPAWSGPGSIDGTDPMTGTPGVELDGVNIPLGTGLTIGSDVAVRGLAIGRFTSAGILITGDRNRVSGCYVGTDATGIFPAGNGSAPSGVGGIYIRGGSENVIGGEDHDSGRCNRECNVISANGNAGVAIEAFFAPATAQFNQILGNFIGTDVLGAATDPDGLPGSGDELGNTAGVAIVGAGATNNSVGVETRDFSGELTDAGANRIVGSTFNQVRVLGAADNRIQNNALGSPPSAPADLGSGFSGVFLFDAPGSLVLDNVIAGSDAFAVLVDEGSDGALVARNSIGLVGDVAVGNAGGVVLNSSDSDVRENVISASTGMGTQPPVGQLGHGLLILGDRNDVYKNRIGVAADGTRGAANFRDGVRVEGDENCIGTIREFTGSCETGPMTAGPEDANLISANLGVGVSIRGQRNQIVGNVIGADISRSLERPNALGGLELTSGATQNEASQNLIAFNAVDGALATGGASDNLVTLNEIARNAGDGVRVEGVTTLRNTITLNSISANRQRGLRTIGGGNQDLPPPLTTQIDLPNGVVQGTSCPGCTVELFHDARFQGEIFVASVTADAGGAFSFNVGPLPPNRNVTCTATDPAGNTSAFGCTALGDDDGDGIPNAEDNCSVWPNDQSDTDGNGIGDDCECGDQSGDGRVNVEDILRINDAIFDPPQARPLCDTNDDRQCDVRDILGVNAKIFGAEAHCERYPAPADD